MQTANEIVQLLRTITPEPQVEVLDLLYELKDASKEAPSISKSKVLEKHKISLRSSTDRMMTKVEDMSSVELKVLREDLSKLVKRYGLS